MSKQNTKRSGGPKTTEGKARSAQNAFRHGLTSHTIVLAHEDPKEFDDFRQCYIDTFAPANFLEAELVDEIVKAKWRLKRLALYEKIALDEQREYLRQHYPEPEVAERTKVGAMNKALELCKAIELLPRYEAGFQRHFYRALNKLLELRAKGLQFGDLHPPLEKVDAPSVPPAAPPPTPDPAPSSPSQSKQAVPSLEEFLQSPSSFRSEDKNHPLLRMSDHEFEDFVAKMMERVV